MSDTASIIRAARQLITPPEAWTQFALARNKRGKQVGHHSKNAACFCLMGALGRVSLRDQEKLQAAREAIWKLIPAVGIAEFNDTRTHGEVLALLDKAALAAEAAA